MMRVTDVSRANAEVVVRLRRAGCGMKSGARVVYNI